MQEPLVRLIYVSHATHTLSADSIFMLLSRARSNNSSQEITGVLAFNNGRFLQILEGPRMAVERLFSHIKKDPRHHGILMVERVQVTERVFSSWSMGWIEQADLARADLDLTTVESATSSAYIIQKMLAAFNASSGQAA